MSTPEFILELRERIDHMPLWLIGVTGYVRRDDGLIPVSYTHLTLPTI